MNYPANFDRIARSYRCLEYVALGRALERCRLHFLPQLTDHSHTLVLGDGDGRFLAHLLATNSRIDADAVDSSAAMLALLRKRCAFASTRLTTHHTDALAFAQGPLRQPHRYDLVVTHFFLDCLSQAQLETLAAALAQQLAPDTLWLVSDFRIPAGLMRVPARILVRALYLAFRILTGLRPDSLPDHAATLTRIGLTRIACHRSFLGVLTTELWACRPSSSPANPLES